MRAARALHAVAFARVDDVDVGFVGVDFNFELHRHFGTGTPGSS